MKSLNSVSDIKDCFERVTGNTSIIIYVNKTENRITFKIKRGCYLELLTPETDKLLWSTKSTITKDKNE